MGACIYPLTTLPRLSEKNEVERMSRFPDAADRTCWDTRAHSMRPPIRTAARSWFGALPLSSPNGLFSACPHIRIGGRSQLEGRGTTTEIIGGFALIMVCLLNGKEYAAIAETNVALAKHADAIP
ncbi:uncharacterized protein [Physcomitrium patens]|uniref:uncharacterized protein isoform X5 n=1 Tax=Physcomitrium patens TaxID=3218 RepID=UPI003CCCAEF3